MHATAGPPSRVPVALDFVNFFWINEFKFKAYATKDSNLRLLSSDINPLLLGQTSHTALVN